MDRRSPTCCKQHAAPGTGVLVGIEQQQETVPAIGTETASPHIAIVGAGFTGMVCALRLLKAGYRVTLLEAQSDTGGLTASYDFGHFRWDKFYHCILTSDLDLLTLLDELGLTHLVRWTNTKVGLFSHGQLHTMTGVLDLLHFPHLSLVNKLRLAVVTAYITRLKDGNTLEQQPLESWTRRLFGDKLFTEVWEPLFRCKLGEMRHKASAAFLWGTVRRLASTRQPGPGKAETLGYVAGGYAVVFKRLLEEVIRLDGRIQTSSNVLSICAAADNAGGVKIESKHGSQLFDGALATLPNKLLQGALQTPDTAYLERLGEVQYLGLVCLVLVLRRPLSDFYVTNITEECPFTGIIEMTNLIDPEEETAGYSLVYLPRYTAPLDPLLQTSPEELWSLFRPALLRLHPCFSDADIVNRFTFRQQSVQPVPSLNYSRIRPSSLTPIPNVFLANTAQIVNNTLNNNVMTRLAEQACAQLMEVLPLREVHTQRPIRTTPQTPVHMNEVPVD